MFSDRVFLITLIFSLTFHGMILFYNPRLNIFDTNKSIEKLEVNYIKAPPKDKEITAKPSQKQEPFLRTPAKILAEHRSPPPFTEKEKIFKPKRKINPEDLGFTKPSLIKTEIVAIKKRITLPSIDMNKTNNPSYISYYQIVREKIKRSAYRNYTRTEVGEIYLSFIISRDGLLRDVRLNEEKSALSLYLREVALKSLDNASPFPNFPKELNYPQLSFNVAISFEIE
ncbi:hypothetical protein D4R78_04545 [bacterium]|nr:MAG: hypothetical protein D4R78_04545 [bacterium]